MKHLHMKFICFGLLCLFAAPIQSWAVPGKIDAHLNDNSCSNWVRLYGDTRKGKNYFTMQTVRITSFRPEKAEAEKETLLEAIDSLSNSLDFLSPAFVNSLPTLPVSDVTLQAITEFLTYETPIDSGVVRNLIQLEHVRVQDQRKGELPVGPWRHRVKVSFIKYRYIGHESKEFAVFYGEDSTEALNNAFAVLRTSKF